jgi:hypothetical protein
MNRRRFLKGASGLVLPAAPALFLPKPLRAQFITLGNQGVVAGGGGGGPSFTYPIAAGISGGGGSGDTSTLTGVNAGTGTKDIILAVAIQGNNNGLITSLLLNSTALTSIITDANSVVSLYAGNVSGLTGSDTITINTSASVDFEDIDAAIWVATGLTSITPLAKGSSIDFGNAPDAIVLPASPGNLLFVATSASGSVGTIISPTGITSRALITGADNLQLLPADATLTSGMISGGDVTVAGTADVAAVAAIWD